MINAEIEFEIKINKGHKAGQLVTIKTDIEELEEEDISSLLIEAGHLSTWRNDEEYNVRSRTIKIIED